MSTSPSRKRAVLRREDGRSATAARFDVEFRTGDRVPAELLATAKAGAQAAGYAAGWAQGQQHAREAARAAAEIAAAEARQLAEIHDRAVRSALAALAAGAEQLARRATPVLAELEEQILDAAVRIAEAILEREVSRTGDAGVEALRRALALAPTDRPVTVRLHPADHAVITHHHPSGGAVAGRTVELVADATLRPGDAVAESDITVVDARLPAAVERVRAALRPPTGESRP